jgi:hypothetical protein
MKINDIQVAQTRHAAAFGNARRVPILKAPLGPHFADTTLTTTKPWSGQFIAVHWDS